MQNRMFRIGAGGLKPIVDPLLVVGQILWLNGYGQSQHSHDRRVVYRIEETNYRRNYHAVNIDKMTLSIESHPRPEAEIFGIGIYYTPGDVFENVGDLSALVEKARENDANLKAQAEQAASEKAERERIEREALPARYPYLIPFKNAGNISPHALGAKNMKAELSRQFPGVKFSVKSESYSGGDSISVKWPDGPTSKEVEAFTDKYQECDFDGMQDLETYRRAIFPSVFGGAKYVSESRNISTARYLETAARLGYPSVTIDDQWNWNVDHETREQISRETYATSYYVKP